MKAHKKENQKQQATTVTGEPHLCNWKTNRKSLSQAWFPVKTLFESLKQLFPNQCGVWLQWNFGYWDVVERGPRSELSSYWARQTAAWSRGGGMGAHPCLPHTPCHPTPQCHFTSDLILSPRPSFMFTLTSFPLCHPSLGRRCSITADTKHLNVQVTFSFCFLPFSSCFFSSFFLKFLSLNSIIIVCHYTVPTFQKQKMSKKRIKYNIRLHVIYISIWWSQA